VVALTLGLVDDLSGELLLYPFFSGSQVDHRVVAFIMLRLTS
jgi:hypothetical protein